MKTLLSLLLLLLSLTLSAASLWAASHLPLLPALAAIWFFALINNMPFALMHEAVHGVAADSPRLNTFIGTIAGWAFPTSFSMQRVAHLGHHQRNRSDDDLYDYYLPGQSRALRNFWLYAGNLLGLYWWSVLYSNLIYALAPGLYRSRFFVEQIAPRLGFGPYVRELAALPPRRVWLEVVAALGYQLALFSLLDLDSLATFACYMAFALHWSALQYADHAWSARDVRNGAWNLRVLPLSRWLALNYHYHLAHHQQPQLPWYELPRHVDRRFPQPSFWRVYFSLWRGVRPAPPMGAPADTAFLFPGKGALRQET